MIKKLLVGIIFSSAFSYGITLDEAVQKALEENLQIKKAKYEVNISKFNLKKDLNLWYPQFFLDFSYNIFKDTPFTEIPLNLPFPQIRFKQFNKEFSQFDIGFNYPIFTGFQRVYKINISKLELESTKYLQNEKVLEIIHKTKLAYIDVLKAKAILDIYKSQEKSIKFHLTQAKNYLEEGLVTKVDLLEAKVNLKKVKTKLKEAKSNLKLAKEKLNFLLNQPLDKNISVEDLNLNLENNTFNLKDLYKQALRKKYTLKILKVKQKQLHYLAKIEKSKFFPKVYLQTKYFYTDQYPYLEPKGNFSLGFAARINFQGITPYYSYLKNKLEEKKVHISIEEAKKAIKLSVKQAYEKLLIAKEKIKMYKTQLEEAQEFYNLVKQQYENQLTDMTHLLNAESYLTTAKKNLKIAKYEYIKAYFDLEYIVGGKLENE